MSRRRIWAVSWTVAAFVAVGATGFLAANASDTPGAAGGHWGHGRGDRFGFELYLRQLDLNETQRGQIKSILQQQLLEQRIQTALAIRNVLTPGQLAHAAQLKAQIDALHEQMHNLLAPPSSMTPE